MELTALNGGRLTDSEDIREETIMFYKSLMGSVAHTFPAVNREVMKKGPTLSHQQQLELCKDVTEREVYEGRCSIGDDKDPGVDGYNAIFFKKTWHIIKAEASVCSPGFF